MGWRSGNSRHQGPQTNGFHGEWRQGALLFRRQTDETFASFCNVSRRRSAPISSVTLEVVFKMLLRGRIAPPRHSAAWPYTDLTGLQLCNSRVIGCYGGDVALNFTSHKISPRESCCAGAATSEPSRSVLCRSPAHPDRISARETAQVGHSANS